MAQTGEDAPEIGELLTMIARDAPSRISELKIRHPRHQEFIELGAVLGDDGSTMGWSTDLGCDVATEALSLYGAIAGKLRSRLRSRLAWTRRFDLWAKIAASVGSGGTVGMLAAGIGAERSAVAAVIAFLGSVSALYVSYLQRDVASGSIAAAYNKLIDGLVEADQLQRSLRTLCPAGASRELTRALARANDVARTLNELALRLG